MSSNSKGFTFIEVLVAMLIFVLAVVASIQLTDGSVRATREAREISTATWLLQNVMVELETKLETEGFDKGCEKKKEAKFQAPYDKFTWTTTCQQIDFNISQTAAKLAQQENSDNKSPNDVNQTDMITKMVLQASSDYMTKSLREIHAEISWLQGKTKRKIDLTTHVARYDQPLTISVPNASNTSGGGSGGGSTTGGGGGGGGGTPH